MVTMRNWSFFYI